MPKKKKAAKKQTCECCPEEKFDPKKLLEVLRKKAGEIKKKYDHLDQNSKKKIMAGAAGALALLAGIGLVKKTIKKTKKKLKK